MKVLLPTTLELTLDADGVDPVLYDPSLPVPAEHEDAEVLVVWGNPDDQLRDAAARLRSVRLVQTLAAGPDAVVAAGFVATAHIASGRSLHDRPVTEHALALVLAAARRLHTMVRAQLGHRWASELGGMQPEKNPEVFTTLRDANVLIWGFGGIARTLAPLLTALGANVTGVATTAREDSGYRVIAVDDIEAELPTADVLLMILPSVASTRHALSAKRIALLPKHAWLVNVGRGSTVDEDALIDALAARRIGGAALDVTSVEPLPPSSRLWDLPNAIITPHAAGGRPLGASALISANIAAISAGNAPRNLVAR